MREASTCLVPAKSAELARTTGENPLVARGLRYLERGSSPAHNAIADCDLKNPVTYYLHGLNWYGKRDYCNARKALGEAIRLFDEAIQIGSNNAFAFRHRGKAGWIRMVAEESDDTYESSPESKAKLSCEYSKAMKDFDEAIRLDPTSAVAYIERGEAWLWGYSKPYPKELKDFDEAIRLEPDNAGWYTLRGIAWSDVKDYDKAITDLKEAIRLNPPDQSYVDVAFTSTDDHTIQFSDYDGGNPFLFAGVRVKLYEKLAAASLARAYYLYEKERYDLTIKDFDEAIRFGPKDAVAHLLRGCAHELENDFDKAIEDYNEALRCSPNESATAGAYVTAGAGRKLTAAYYWRGMAMLEKQDYDQAMIDFVEVIIQSQSFSINAECGKTLLAKSVAELDLSSRTRKCLDRMGIKTLGDLVSRSADELLETKTFGMVCLTEVREHLYVFGLRLGGD